MQIKPFYFMRHGETDWNRRRIHMGSTDIPLNNTGIAQAHTAAKIILGEPVSHIASSPLSRALKTAQIVAVALKTPITIIDELKECYLGLQQGQPKKDYTDPAGESDEDFTARVMHGIGNALKLPGTVLIVAHGGVYRPLITALGLRANDLQNCGIVHFQPSVEKDPVYNLRYLY